MNLPLDGAIRLLAWGGVLVALYSFITVAPMAMWQNTKALDKALALETRQSAADQWRWELEKTVRALSAKPTTIKVVTVLVPHYIESEPFNAECFSAPWLHRNSKGEIVCMDGKLDCLTSDRTCYRLETPK